MWLRKDKRGLLTSELFISSYHNIIFIWVKVINTLYWIALIDYFCDNSREITDLKDKQTKYALMKKYSECKLQTSTFLSSLLLL